jgi:putative ABC transport system permease protein
MRALGARRGTVMSIILLESILLALGGGLAGLALGHGLIKLLDPVVESHTGVSIGLLQFERAELILIPALVILAALAGFLPSLAAYRTDVAKALSDRP